MKRLLLLALCALFAPPSSADQAVVGKRTWSFDVNPDGKTCAAVGVFPANGKISVPAKLGGCTVTRVAWEVFDNPTVTSLTLPAGVKEIAYDNGGGFWNDFGGLYKLKTLKVASGNRTFSAKGGVLYDKKKTKVLAVLPSKKGTYKVPASVRTIGDDAFCGSSLSSVVLPKKLKTIEGWAFRDMLSLKTITIPASVTAIGECAFAPQTTVLVAKKNKKFSAAGGVLFDKKKKTLLHCPATKKGAYKVPASVTAIAESAFEGCTGLTSVSLGKKVKIVGDYAFEGCKGLKSVKIPAGVDTVGYAAFASCTKLKSATLANGVKHLGDNAFGGCTALKSLTIPASVATLGWIGTGNYDVYGNPFGGSGVKTVQVAAGNRTFAVAGGCLVSKDKKTLVAVPPARKGALSIPSSVTSIDSDAFDGCGKLTSIAIPAGVDYVWAYCFRDCTTWNAKKKKFSSALTSFTVASGNPSYSAAGGVLFSKDKKTLVAYPIGKAGAYTVPSSVTEIGPNAFSDAYAVTKITVPDSVKTIGDWAFSNCPKLASVRLPSKLSAIPGGLFSGDSALKSVSIPATVTSIGSSAFGGSGLKSVSIPSKVASIGDDAFGDCKKLASVTVPASVKTVGAETFGAWDRKAGIKTLSLPNKGACDVPRQELPASCKVVYRDKGNVYWIRLVSNGGSLRNSGETSESVYDANGTWIGNSVRSFAFRDRASALRANPFEKGGSAFAGWATTPGGAAKYKDKASVKNLVAAGRTATLYAKWRPVKTTYQFKANGGSGSMAPFVVDYDTYDGCLPACAFTRAGWTFDHWSTQADGSGEWYDDKDWVYCQDDEKDVTVTLYAIWGPNLTVTFNANGGSGSMARLVIPWGADDYIPDCSFTRDGWAFDHWSTASDDSGGWYDPWDWISNYDDSRTSLTLYAIWYKDGYYAPAPASGAAPQDLASVVSLVGNLPVDSLGDAPWTESELDGEPCAESGAIGDGGTSVLRAEVEGPGTLAFRWRTSSEEGRDIVFLSVDGEDVAARSGLDGDWATVSLRVEGDGPHVLSWTYAKDASGSAGDDRARLADVVWLPD